MTEMQKVLLLDAVRTPFGRYRGGLSDIRTDDLAAMPIAELVGRQRDFDPAAIDDVYYGNTNGAGEENRNVARMAALLAGLPVTVPGVTLNRLCASGAEALIQAGRAIATGDATALGAIASQVHGEVRSAPPLQRRSVASDHPCCSARARARPPYTRMVGQGQ